VAGGGPQWSTMGLIPRALADLFNEARLLQKQQGARIQVGQGGVVVTRCPVLHQGSHATQNVQRRVSIVCSTGVRCFDSSSFGTVQG
jgi:hypothetical protein